MRRKGMLRHPAKITVLWAMLAVAVVAVPGTGRAPANHAPGAQASDAPTPLAAPPEGPSPAAQSHIENFTLTAAFMASLQGLDGGEIEAEDNPFENTDNTLEAIWIWSRYYNLTGDVQYDNEIAAAWAYAEANPAWLEPDSGKVYSSAWAVRAEMEYRRAYGDSSHLAYGLQAADYIVSRSAWEPLLPILPLVAKEHIRGWAAGNLYDYGLDLGNDAYRWNAVNYANATKASIEADSALLKSEGWALAGGASMWGVVHARMAEFPDPAWAEAYGGLLKTEVTSPGAGAGNSQNGWEAWYALGHHAVYSVTMNMTHYDTFLNITGRLIQRDGDRDGGIPTNVGDPDNTDESWVTAYRAFFCLRQLLSPDAGIPPDPVFLNGADLSADLKDVVLTWSAPAAQDVDRFDVYSSTTYDRNGTGYTLVGSAPATETAFTHVGAGANLTSHFYRLTVVDTEGFTTATEYQMGKFYRPLNPGPNLVSIPLESSFPVTKAFQTVEYDWVRSFDLYERRWLAYDVGKTPDARTLDVVMDYQAYWVNVTAPSAIHVAGSVRPTPLQMPIIHGLSAGWNAVGFPYLSPRTVAETFPGVPLTGIEGYDSAAPEYHLEVLDPSDLLYPGDALWVRVDSDTQWFIDRYP